MVVAADDVVGQAIHRRAEIYVVGRIGRDAGAKYLSADNHRDGSEGIDPEIDLLSRQTQILSNLRVTETASQLVERGGRGDQLEGRITEQANENPAGRPLRSDQATDDDVRVEDGAHERLGAGLWYASPGPMLGLVGETIRLGLRRWGSP